MTSKGMTRAEEVFQTIPALVNFEVSIMPSWVVEEWNGIESSHFRSSCQVAWDFSISFQNKLCLAPHLILSGRSMCLSLPRHLTCLFFILLLVMAICGAQGRV